MKAVWPFVSGALLMERVTAMRKAVIVVCLASWCGFAGPCETRAADVHPVSRVWNFEGKANCGLTGADAVQLEIATVNNPDDTAELGVAIEGNLWVYTLNAGGTAYNSPVMIKLIGFAERAKETTNHMHWKKGNIKFMLAGFTKDGKPIKIHGRVTPGAKNGKSGNAKNDDRVSVRYAIGASPTNIVCLVKELTAAADPSDPCDDAPPGDTGIPGSNAGQLEYHEEEN
jgi:hypothetical protein